jgi:regulator of replication initiation timing
MCVATVWALYREIDEVGTITLVLWAFTICAICFAITAGYTTFDPEYIKAPSDAFADPSKFFISLGVAARFAVYDFTGYYDVNFVGKECQNPRRTIPIACTTTCVVVAMIFFLVDIAVIGSLEWNPDKGGYVKLVTSGDDSANYIMALFCETHIGRGFAIFFTVVVAVTIFGSCFSFMIGLAQIPYTAAKDGYFYNFLSHEHEHYKGLSDYSLLFVGLLSTIFCFLDLQIVIEGMLTMQLLIQFMAQGFGLMYYRYLWPEEDQEQSMFPCPLFPIPCIIQLTIFGFIFATTDTYVFHGNAPLLEVAMLFILMGCGMYFLWARSNGFWPFFDPNSNESDLEDWEHMVVYVAGENEDEFTVLKRRLAIREREIRRLEGLGKNAYSLIAEKDRDLNVSHKSLDNKSYKIMKLARKLDEQEGKIDELTKALEEVTKRNTRAHIKNDEMRRRLHELQAYYGIMEDDEEDISSEHDDIDFQDVFKWGMEKVQSWWRRNLPKSAQTYLAMVRECQMTGKDLLELDMGMLQTFGMKKLLAKQIMSQIEPLRIESEAAKIDPLHAKVYSKMEKEEDQELNRIRGMDKVNAKSKAAMNGMLTNVLKKKKHEI